MGIVLPMSPTETHRYISVQQAADRAAVSTKTVRRWIATGDLVAYRHGPRLIRIRLDDLDLLLMRRVA